MEFNCTVYHPLALSNLIGVSSKYAMANADDCSHIIAHLIDGVPILYIIRIQVPILVDYISIYLSKNECL